MAVEWLCINFQTYGSVTISEFYAVFAFLSATVKQQSSILIYVAKTAMDRVFAQKKNMRQEFEIICSQYIIFQCSHETALGLPVKPLI